MANKVILVGAGPGDPGLLTLKGAQELFRADVVVFDRLISPEIMAMIPKEAELVDVGKEASSHKVPQELISRILVDKALEGKRVVRLKGGDPFVFGRGGEELELLRQHGVEFEVVPGVTSAIAAPAYGGIPVTHRDYSSSLHVITGHMREGKPLDIDFDALLRAGGTLVFLMGVSAAAEIAEGLLSAGMDEDMPCAIIEQGTTPRQRRVDTVLKNLRQKALDENIQSPAVIVVGRVCELAENLCWFDRLPLRGKRILVTRPAERAGALSDRLRALGAEVSEYPCIKTVPIYPCPEMQKELLCISEYEWLCLTSPAGVDYFWNGLRKLGLDARALSSVKLAAIGSGTAAALNKYGLWPDLVPETYDAINLGRELCKAAHGRVLILRAEHGSTALTDELLRCETEFKDIAIYKTLYENPLSEKLREMLSTGELEYVTFTSASTVRGFALSVGEDSDFSKICGLCIGAQTAEEAKKYGIPVRIAQKATIDSLAQLAAETI